MVINEIILNRSFGILYADIKNSNVEYILRLLSGESFDDINKTRLNDDKVNKCRNVLKIGI